MSANFQTHTTESQAGVVNSGKKPNGFIRWTKLLLKSKTGTVGFIIVLFVCIVAAFANYLALHDPAAINPAKMLKPPSWMEGGEKEHILGTDNLGRDMLSRIIYGSRVSLLVGIASVILAGIIGIIVGLASGYYGGWLDTILMRIVDSFLSIPNILFALVFLAVFGPSVPTLIIVLGVTNWVAYARIVRGETLSIKEREFVKAARSLGVRNVKIISRHVLPNVISSFIVISTLSIATTIILGGIIKLPRTWRSTSNSFMGRNFK